MLQVEQRDKKSGIRTRRMEKIRRYIYRARANK
jgi:hypothetical protein